MVMPAEIARVNIIWTPQSAWSGEQAVCGFWVHHHHFTGNNFSWDSDLQGLADGVLERLVSHWGSLQGQFASGFKVSEVRAAQIGTDGKEINAKTAVQADNTLSGTGNTAFPPEVAMVIGFYSFTPGTFQQKPAQRRGRMYVPYLAASMGDGQGKVSQPATKLTAWQDFFNDVQGAHAGDQVTPGNDWDFWELATVSKVSGEWHQVTNLVLDDHFDSQRRRQHQSPSLKFTATIDH